MPDCGGRQALHRLCDSVSGVNWRPTRFEDELTVNQYACRACHVVPNTTVVLPCSHLLCEQCVTGCVIQDGGRVCPLDAEPFCEDECQKLKLPDKKKRNLKAHCWNEADGCEFVGTIEAVLLHFDRECAFHAVQCSRCERRILRTDIAAHYVTGCSRNAYSASGAQAHRHAGSSSSSHTSVILDKFSTLQRQMNEVSARSQDVSRAVGGVENSLQRGIESIEANICTMLDRRLNAGLEELKASNPCGDHLSSLQSQMNELVEQSRQRDASQMQEIARVLTDSQIKVKDDVKVQMQEIVPVVRVSVTELKENVKTQLEELVHVMKDSEGELKEHVSRVEASLSSRLADQRQSLPGTPDCSVQNKESTERERPLAAGTTGEEEILWRFKQDVFNESLKCLEFLRQETYRHAKQPWVSKMSDLTMCDCGIGRNHFVPSRFYVILEDCGNISWSDEIVYTVTNKYYSDMRMQIRFFPSNKPLDTFDVELDCVKIFENSSFSFPEVTVNAVKGDTGVFVPFYSMGWHVLCYSERIVHFCASFYITRADLLEGCVMKNGKLKLMFLFK